MKDVGLNIHSNEATVRMTGIVNTSIGVEFHAEYICVCVCVFVFMYLYCMGNCKIISSFNLSCAKYVLI